MADYRFLTTWLIDAPRPEVFQAIWNSERWPDWWPGVRSVTKLEGGDSEGVGSLGRYAFKSRLPYDLSFELRTEEVERPRLMRARAVGALDGTGTWRLFEEDGATAVLYLWDVSTTEAWMNLLAPVARPLFEWNHDLIMRWGGEGLARHLGVRLIARG